ncbi:hypothetical protein Salmi_Mp092 (mitochondrion) [Salvia miltiorrhiza]|uniref:Uncharacterized protein n=1 Tax=Salvia miltiorrhiza TaxID=226208 RepID=V9P4S6_SALMI|nr:hypothetical protein Salmi_Mp092 [Salvia miltiorrhiza]AGU16620.1 hypothetical protein Salmi_Mp092 [Salvia miltiorrhiza]
MVLIPALMLLLLVCDIASIGDMSAFSLGFPLSRRNLSFLLSTLLVPASLRKEGEALLTPILAYLVPTNPYRIVHVYFLLISTADSQLRNDASTKTLFCLSLYGSISLSQD